MKSLASNAFLILGLAAASATIAPVRAIAQPSFGPAPVGVTAARSMPLAPTVTLTGTVRSRTSTLVASEVPGLVTRLAVREGDSIRRGAPIVHLRSENLTLRIDAVRGQRREALARLELARQSLTRSQELFDSGVISRQDLDGAISESDAWQGRVDQADADIARLEDDLDRSIVRAPFNGVVVAEHCQVGAWLTIGGPVVEMVDPNDLEVVIDVPERYFAATRRGTSARVRFPALAGSSSAASSSSAAAEIEGTVVAVIPRADAMARTFPTKVRIANPEGRIGIGMLAEVLLPAGTPRPAVIVPKDAIVEQGGQRMVYVVERGADGAVANPRPVTVGGGTGGWVEVTGITSDAEVVTRGNERLMPGAQVVPEPKNYDPPAAARGIAEGSP